MKTEVIYPDGSTSTFQGEGSFHEGHLAIERLRLITAKHALQMFLNTGMELTYQGSKLAAVNVVGPIMDKDYRSSSGRLTKKGKREALEDCIYLLALLENSVVVWNEDDGDGVA